MNKVLKVAAMASCLLWSPIGVTADRPVFELMELTGVQAANQATIEQSKQQIDAMLDQLIGQIGNENPQVRRAIQRYQDGSLALISSAMEWERVGPRTAEVMESVYTDEEIRQLIAFYKTEVGQMLQAKQPQLTQELMAKQGEEMQRMTDGLQQLMQQLMSDLKNVKR